MGFSECDRKTSLGPKSHISIRRAFVPDPSMPGYEWSLEHIEEVCHFPQEPNDRGDAAKPGDKLFPCTCGWVWRLAEGGEGKDGRGEKGDRHSAEFY